MPCCSAFEAGAGTGSEELEVEEETAGMRGFLTVPAFLAWGRLIWCGLWKAVSAHESWFKDMVWSSSSRYQVLSSAAQPLLALL